MTIVAISTMRLLMRGGHFRRNHPSQVVRQVSTKQIEWCTPKGSSFRNQNRHRKIDDNHSDFAADGGTAATAATTDTNDAIEQQRTVFEPIDRFGIVAAMASKSRVVGMNGKLPWGRLSQDRRLFENLTRDRILIVGRRTLLEEQLDLNHVSHAKCCIVVSTTLSNMDEILPKAMTENGDSNSCFTIKLARSLAEALHVAREIDTTDTDLAPNRGTSNKDSPSDTIDDSTMIESSKRIQCWVAGGERLYAEALTHDSAKEVHLSVVDTVIDLSTASVEQIARFPAKYRWDNKYSKVSETAYPSILSDEGTILEPSFTHFVYDRVVHQRENCIPCQL
jgi:dihydrofolate reductase